MKLPYPKAVGFIVANEFCERFSFYGMKAVLSLYLRNKLGYTDNGATVIFHVFSMLCYVFPFIGAIIADGFLGKYRTILYLSCLYACGTTLIAVGAVPPLSLPVKESTLLALLLIAMGTGGIKPCVAAFGGDQFKLPEQNKQLSGFFSVFYFSINAGSLLSMFLTPILRKDVHCFNEPDCYSFAFGVPGVLMITAIICFYAGKRFYIIKDPTGNVIGRVLSCVGYATMKAWKSKEKRKHFMDHADDKYDPQLVEDIKGLLRVLILYIPLPVFWALFDQQGSRWTFQADRMEHELGPYTFKPDQMQIINPLLILILIPIYEMVIYPCLERTRIIRKALHRIIYGGLLAALAFIISGIVEINLQPTYGTPVSDGLAQLRVFNGFDCGFDIKLKNEVKGTIPALSFYEKLDIKAANSINIPYEIKGHEGTECAGKTYSGEFELKEKTANSVFISEGISNFVDDNSKAIDGVRVRFLSNIKSAVDINLQQKGSGNIRIRSDNMTQIQILKGVRKITVDKKPVLDLNFRTGGVYTIIIYQNGDSYVAKWMTITPPNSLHILWQIPQYVVMTMGEVMFSVTGLEFSFTQAPVSMKSILQAVWLLTVAFGNLIVVVIVQGSIMDVQWKEFFLFAGLMILDMIMFTWLANRYKYVEAKSSTTELSPKKPGKDIPE